MHTCIYHLLQTTRCNAAKGIYIPGIPQLQANVRPLQFLQQTHSLLFTTHFQHVTLYHTRDGPFTPRNRWQQSHIMYPGMPSGYIWRDTVLPECALFPTGALTTPNMATQSEICFEVHQRHTVFTMASPSWGLGNKRWNTFRERGRETAFLRTLVQLHLYENYKLYMYIHKDTGTRLECRLIMEELTGRSLLPLSIIKLGSSPSLLMEGRGLPGHEHVGKRAHAAGISGRWAWCYHDDGSGWCEQRVGCQQDRQQAKEVEGGICIVLCMAEL